ncbi:MAG: TrbC/VirB2 family protein [Clostridia bacterium]
MKKFTKIFLKIMPVVFVAFIMVSSVMGISATTPDTGSKITGITDLADNLWSTVATIVQILAIAAIVIAGVRYMFASANDKADIKKQTLILVAGAILVFAAVPIAQFIQNTASGAISPTVTK